MKALFFSPHAFIWRHAFPGALTAEALRSQGHEVIQIGCNRDLRPHCVVMDSEGISEFSPDFQRDLICAACVKKKAVLRQEFDFEYAEISDYLSPSERLEIEQHIRTVTPANILGFTLDGCAVGRASLYEFILINKRLSIDNLTSDEWKGFLRRFHGALVSFYAGRNAINRYKPDFLFFYAIAYSCNAVVSLYAKKLGITCYSLVSGVSWADGIQRIRIYGDDFPYHRNIQWAEKYHLLPATLKGLRSAASYQKSLVSGKSVMIYGGKSHRIPAQEIKRRWGILEHQKVLLMATSSYDEFYSAQVIGAIPADIELCFSNQIEWIQETMAFVEKRPDLFLVIRIHPREFPNRREGRTSSHALELEKLLKGALPPNVRVNWHSEGLSLYDCLEVVDLGLTAWSSAGREFASWGIPNVTYAESLCFFPAADLSFTASEKGQYFAQIDTALKAGWDPGRLLRTYRWLAHELEGDAFDISDSVPSFLNGPKPFWLKVARKVFRGQFEERLSAFYHRRPVSQSELILKRVVEGVNTDVVLESTLNRLSAADEDNEIKRAVAIAVEALWGPGWRGEPQPSTLRKNLRQFLGREAPGV